MNETQINRKNCEAAKDGTFSADEKPTVLNILIEKQEDIEVSKI